MLCMQSMTQELGESGRLETDLGSSTWTDVAARGSAVLLIPLGSCEQHGPHLPLDTDARIAVAVAEAVSDRRSDVVVAPCLAYGASGEHQSFPGTLSMGTDALAEVVIQLGRSALPQGSAPDQAPGSPVGAVVVVNGHGGNLEAVQDATSRLQAESRQVVSWAPRIEGADAHAGRTETSLMLHIAPHLVRAERPAGATQPLAELSESLRTGGVAAVSENGVLGDARGASAEEGARLLAELVEQLDSTLGPLIEGLPAPRQGG